MTKKQTLQAFDQKKNLQGKCFLLWEKKDTNDYNWWNEDKQI